MSLYGQIAQGNTAILVGEGFDMNTPRGNYYFKKNPTPPYGKGTSHLRSYIQGKV